jgi:hypothetical protein
MPNFNIQVIPQNNTLLVVDNDQTQVVITNPITSTVQVNSLGPPGAQGPPGVSFPYTGSAIITGSLVITGSVIATQGFSGNVTGTSSYSLTASYVQNAISSSYSSTASYALNTIINTGSLVTTSSFNVLTSSFNSFTSSYNTGSFTGSFTGNGSGLTNIPASGIVGLNLSRIATGSVTSSVDIGSTSFTIENAGSNLLTVSNVGVVVVSQSINIGRAEDGDYTDGLYTDVTPATTVGTMVDRFNEILKGLSPAPAPNLDNLESVSSGTNNQFLAFGASVPTSSYSNVLGTGSLSAVNFTQSFIQSTGTGGGRLRLGTFSATTILLIRLNEDINADGSPFTNYPENAFNVPVAGGESYTLEINGNTFTETTTGTGSLSGTYFTLTSGSTGFFPATGLPFNIFFNRTGTVSIPTVLWRNGWNFVRVRQGVNITNFVDWVYDPAAASGNFTYTFTGFTTSSVSPTGEKALSGIKYYTGFSYNVTGSIGNYYKNVYNTSSKSFSNVTTGLIASSVSIPTPTTANSTITVNSTHTLAVSDQRLLSQSLSSTLLITNDFSKTGTTGAITTPTILLDNNNTANTTIAENFCLENRRVPSASYDTQVSATNAIGTFPSASALGSSDLAVYAGSLRYPTRVLNSGNVSGANIFYAIAGQPNYSGATGTRYFYRVFTNGASQLAGWSITINGTSTSFVSFGTALTGNNMRIGIKVPGQTGYRDMLTAAPGAGTYTPTADGVGCQSGGAISLGTAGALSLVSERLPANQVFVLRLEVGSSWSGTISSISITGF